MTSFSWADVCARRLARHGLAAPLAGTPADVAAAVGGTHAQVLSAAELSIGLRLDGVTRAEVRHALWTERSLVKTFGPRGTVHLLRTCDLPMWTGALAAVPHSSPMPAAVRMTEGQADQVIEAIEHAVTSLPDAELTVDELSDAVVAACGSWAGDPVMEAFRGKWPRWRQVLPLAGMRGAVCFGRNRGRRTTYTSPRRWLPDLAPAAGALPDVLRHHLHAFGPSTPERFANWLAAPPAWARQVFEDSGSDLARVEVEGEVAWVSKGDTGVPDDPPRGLRLLPYFDTYAYAVGNDRHRLYPGVAAERAAGNFQVLLVDGVVGGLWHPRRSGRRIRITVEPFGTLTKARRAELDAQVDRVGTILEGSPELTIGEVAVGGHA
ncbi:MAG: winged helix DNA-binding domain-containing protein [Actinophytocola sp.]|uniref:winged helix DNA-binding domain-containing protein n=1 Tax=Actinophytocola sp. TaxID=1872138 RepID=UPI0013222308|nr:winged helix DNA-binding domain-containing protein [Actinophytocola sp.]MPZ82721.1 winged helix DNA-binding domain-containing protein [Actinophytocola sp.]